MQTFFKKSKPISFLKFLVLLGGVFIISCQQGKNEFSQSSSLTKNPKSESTDSSILSTSDNSNSLGVPLTIHGKRIDPKLAPPAKVVPLKKPLSSQQVRNNIHKVLPPTKVKITSNPQINTPGENGFIFPKKIKAKSKIVPAFHQPTEKALPPRYKEGGNYNFQNWNEEQGLVSPFVWAIMEDREENIWLGTRGDGISKFDGNTFIHFTVEEGLTENAIRFLFEDSKGNIWIGTNKGACKYDGKSFTHFTKDEGLTDRIVNYICEDSEQNIWFGTFGGAIKYDGEYFTHYTKETGLSNDYVWSIYEDSKGDFWIGTDYGLNKFDGKNFTQYSTEEGLSNNVIQSIIEDKSGRLWLATLGGGINIFDGDFFLQYTKQQGLNYDFIMVLMNDSQGDIWIASYGGGVCKFDGENFIHYSEEEGMSGNYVRAIMEDKKGDIWSGTEKGANKFAGENFKYFSKKDGLNDNYIISVTEDSNGNIWLTTPKGANKFDGKTITQFSRKEGMSDDNVWYTLEDKNGDLWFSTWKGGVNKFDGKSFTHYLEEQGLTDNTIHVMLEDRNGVLWFGTNNGLTSFDGEAFTQYTEEEGLPFEKFSAIYEDSKGQIWFGFYGRGMLRFDGTTFFHYIESDGLTNDKILNIHEDHLGNIWIGTVGGLYKFDGSSFKHYTVKDGLGSNTIWSINEDKENRIWIGTPEGITLMHLQTTGEYQFFNYGKYEGVVNTNLIHGSAYLDSKNNLWWGTGNQLIRQDLNHDLQSDVKAPMVHINNIEINQQFIDYRRWVVDTSYRASFSFEKKIQKRFDSIPSYGNYPSTLNLPYNINHLTFNFSATDWMAPHKVRYSYIMEGLNKEWSLPNAESKADYRNIPYGNYTFKVRAIGAGEKWSTPLSYHFAIAPPWWHTWWARFLYLVAGVVFVIGIVRWRTLTLKQRERKLAKMVNVRTAEVVEQKEIILKEKERSEELLLNILPAEVAQELKEKGKATARTYDIVSILFTDFKSFTQLSEQVSPEELVAEVNACFEAFDKIVEKYKIEKIKTIGDSYMAASNLPVPIENAEKKTVLAALEMQKFISQRKKERDASGLLAFEMRVGIHTGPVVAGIVGIKKFQYDLWGDTVNTASRMENQSQVGQVNISQDTYELLKGDPDFSFEKRGIIKVKGKGMMEMYFIKNI